MWRSMLHTLRQPPLMRLIGLNVTLNGSSVGCISDTVLYIISNIHIQWWFDQRKHETVQNQHHDCQQCCHMPVRHGMTAPILPLS